jgi:DeoR family transcriptional regulator of aga operon
MAQEGLVSRKHGSVSLTLGQPRRSFEPFEKRSREHLAAKQSIGRITAQLLKPNQTIAMGAGTTTTQVAIELAHLPEKRLQIMTNALNIAMALTGSPNLRVTCTGGDVGSDHYTLTGPVTERALRSHYYDVAVLGVSGITAEEGLTVNGQLDSIALQIMIEQSRRLIVVADAGKVGQVHYARIGALSAVDVLVMDQSAPPAFCKHVGEAGVDLILADS